MWHREGVVITILFEIIHEILVFYRWVVILAAIFSILAAFGVIDTRNRVVWMIGDFFYRATEPALRPIRNILPNFGNIDFSPLVLLVLISVLDMVLERVYAAIVYGNVRGLLL
jgi:YggT family protein